MAATLIKEGCPVILHDSSRIRYQEGLKAFKTVKVLTPGKAEERNVDYHKQPDGLYYHEGVTMAMIY